MRRPGISFCRCAFRRRAHGSPAAKAAPTPDFCADTLIIWQFCYILHLGVNSIFSINKGSLLVICASEF
ncbi:MAG: hypothetical protein COZ70_13310 [Deltaproteobacteria bacterium CG_4_8_14_3_um_filter_51_11]|nr:MAG: hypothetical protein AUK25_02700 [Desulfobacteraceae bacterium CG2_30_51_40]PIX18594.1 MAG: hypothetical protein COZ70_13310 [Deltaproteobacteria bacterium CG_4_8_14_3_um_filter_51_11]PIY27277.1 MAG: hypothetical protein COZ11_00225 [Deltaproteobacteria bacterium CG_4_10_14_3_um_filter_51_14]